jgi:hypothetical protein
MSDVFTVVDAMETKKVEMLEAVEAGDYETAIKATQDIRRIGEALLPFLDILAELEEGD